MKGLTIPFRDGDETREVLLEAVTALGDDDIWCCVSCVSIPFMGGSGRKTDPAVVAATAAGWAGNSESMVGEMWSWILEETTSMEASDTGCSCIDIAMESEECMSEVNMGVAVVDM
jgi:hypothetical protein